MHSACTRRCEAADALFRWPRRQRRRKHFGERSRGRNYKNWLQQNKQLIPETAFAPSVLTEAPAPDDHQENVPALDYPRAQTPECGNTTPTFLSEASTPDLDQENVPPIDSQQRKTPESSDRSPSILTQIPISDVLRGNISPVDCLRSTTSEQAYQSPAIASTSTGQISRVPTMKRSYYRTIYGTSSSSDASDDLPLNQIKRYEFYDLLPTPAKDQTKTPTLRQKAINYRGTSVTKDLFDKFNEEKKNRKKAKTVSAKKSTTIKGTSQKQVSWYCHACEEDRMDDAMRQCSQCFKWYHEQCVGLSMEDTDDFQCPGGCE
ncbi:unnamed protein product [Danaus chrysippus]|uniref:(African queen) hypothetical protein n=1 Tax=Danaus chrysippus TaxID=151541 RepID=A0A8J2QCW6_9NEOP|nr:unnamed protein product [Danaus chrysippus]